MEINKKPEQYKVEIIGSVKRGRGRPRKRFDPVPWNRSDQYRFCLCARYEHFLKGESPKYG